MLKKSVKINEENNEIRYIEKREIKDDYLDTLFKYMCITTDNDESLNIKDEHMVLKNGKEIKKVV